EQRLGALTDRLPVPRPADQSRSLKPWQRVSDRGARLAERLADLQLRRVRVLSQVLKHLDLQRRSASGLGSVPRERSECGVESIKLALGGQVGVVQPRHLLLLCGARTLEARPGALDGL